MAHINRYGSHHTDAILTENHPNAMRFLREVDSASVMVNASHPFCRRLRVRPGRRDRHQHRQVPRPRAGRAGRPHVDEVGGAGPRRNTRLTRRTGHACRACGQEVTTFVVPDVVDSCWFVQPSRRWNRSPLAPPAPALRAWQRPATIREPTCPPYDAASPHDRPPLRPRPVLRRAGLDRLPGLGARALRPCRNHRLRLRASATASNSKRGCMCATAAAHFPHWAARLGDDHLLDLSLLGQISDTALTERTRHRDERRRPAQHLRAGPQPAVLHVRGHPGLPARSERAGGRHVRDRFFRLPRLPRQHAEGAAGRAQPGHGPGR